MDNLFRQAIFLFFIMSFVISIIAIVQVKSHRVYVFSYMTYLVNAILYSASSLFLLYPEEILHEWTRILRLHGATIQFVILLAIIMEFKIKTTIRRNTNKRPKIRHGK